MDYAGSKGNVSSGLNAVYCEERIRGVCVKTGEVDVARVKRRGDRGRHDFDGGPHSMDHHLC